MPESRGFTAVFGKQLTCEVDNMNAVSHENDPLSLKREAPKLVVFQSKERLTEIISSPEPRYTRRLADLITASFNEACRIGNIEAAGQLAAALKCEVARSIRVAGVEDRYDGDDVAAVQARYELEVSKQQEERPAHFHD